ncbi:MAG: hypothetical protein WD557_06400 [Dehalococcoidia bacterium]
MADILIEGRLEARNAHCLVKNRLTELPEEFQSKFNVVCFTECPRSEIKNFARPMKGRSYQVAPFGVAFKKSFLARAIPVFYAPFPADKAAWTIFETLVKAEDWHTLVDFFPFVSQMRSEFDWHWEREWRTAKNVDFEPGDVEAVFCPRSAHADLEWALQAENKEEWYDVTWLDVEDL